MSVDHSNNCPYRPIRYGISFASIFFHCLRSLLSTPSTLLACIASNKISRTTACAKVTPSSTGPCSGEVEGAAV